MAQPRFITESNDNGPSWFGEVEVEAENLGFTLMDWQREAAMLICALKDDGSPLFKEVVLSVPRQSGKTTLMQVILSALAKRTRNYRMYLTAQTRLDALRHLENLGRIVADRVPQAKLVAFRQGKSMPDPGLPVRCESGKRRLHRRCRRGCASLTQLGGGGQILFL